MMPGRVSLVGAGPGDIGLLTLKAKARIEEADIILYDYLVNPAHLEHAKPEAIKIALGKGFRYKRLTQEKINRLIIQSAKKGKKVVRLKGGDPYLFGRGGEEALDLMKNKVPFEVVPGITSAVACAAYAGIPMTHRLHNSSVTFLTGHKADDNNLDSVEWGKIVGLKGTIVVYMGFYNLARIAEKLMRHGLSPFTPVAVIEWGTLPRQRSCRGTLRTIAALTKKLGFGAPAIIIIGRVVDLGDKLNWFEKLPLFGKKIIVTRSSQSSRNLTQVLRMGGADVVDFPTIEIAPSPEPKKMDEAIRSLKKFDWLVFASRFGVDAFFERLYRTHKRDARSLGGLQIAAVGPETAKALLERGISADKIPARYETKALVAALGPKAVRGKNILLIRSSMAPPPLEEGLKKMGARVVTVHGYTTRMPLSISKEIKSAIQKGEYDLVTFTSASTVHHFVKLIGRAAIHKIKKTTHFASIGPVTTQALKKYNLKASCQASTYTTKGLSDAIGAWA